MLSASGRNRLLGVTMLAVTFGVGGLAGAAFTRVLEAQQAEASTASAGGGRCEENKTSILDQLDLSAEQRARIDAIMAARRDQTESFWDSAGPSLSAIMDATRAEVRAVLTPAQQAEYDRLRAERRALREQHENTRAEGDESAK